MKQSELKQLIKEEIKKIVDEDPYEIYDGKIFRAIKPFEVFNGFGWGPTYDDIEIGEIIKIQHLWKDGASILRYVEDEWDVEDWGYEGSAQELLSSLKLKK